MDPLSVTTGVAGIVALAGAVLETATNISLPPDLSSRNLTVATCSRRLDINCLNLLLIPFHQPIRICRVRLPAIVATVHSSNAKAILREVQCSADQV